MFKEFNGIRNKYNTKVQLFHKAFYIAEMYIFWLCLISWVVLCRVFCLGATAQIGPRLLLLEVSKSPTIKHRHPHPIEPLGTFDQPVAEAATNTIYNKH